MATKLDTRQSVNRTALPMVGSSANASLDSILALIDPQLSKLFEDRNVMLQDGGLLTYTGTALQFTEALKIAVNERVSGAAPLVIDLTATTRAFSASGRMLYAVIDRSAGTATVTADATSLPAVVAANQEVFLIAKRVDATDGTKRLYFRSGMAMDEGQTVRLGSSGSGTGSGTGDDINTLKYRASFGDDLSDQKAINTTTGFTDTNLYSAGKKLYRISYDASKTVTTVGTAATLSGTPAFTVKAGDMLIVGTQAKKIVTVNTQTSYVLEAALTANVTASACNVSQAVHTVDVAAFNDSGSGLALNTVFTDSISSFLFGYRDSLALDDAVFDNGVAALIGFSVSTDNSNWSAMGTRPTSILSDVLERSTVTSGTQFLVRFYSTATSGTGAANLLDYKAYLYKDTSTSTGSASLKALARTDGAGTAVNCSVSSSSGKTRITTTFVLGSETQVFLDGKKLPEYVDAIVTPDGAFTRLNGTVIELDADYSGAGLQIEVLVSASVVDSSNTNSTNISAIQDFATSSFQAYIDSLDTIAVPNTTIVNRSRIPNLANDLRTGMGLERVQFMGLTEIMTEVGPNGERVWGVIGDDRGVVRAVGQWTLVNALQGPNLMPTTTTDVIEITFYGTGLNVLCDLWAAVVDHKISVDGGAETTFTVGTQSNVTINRGYSNNKPVAAVSGLTLGIHTAKIRANANPSNTTFYGFEVIGGNTVKVNSGIAYVGGKKIVSAGGTVAYNAAVTGTRGGRVLTYLTAAGAVGQAFTAVNASSATMTSADHTNEDMIRRFYPREFSAGRTNDFGAMNSSGLNASFTHEDGVTNLLVSSGAMRFANGGEYLSANSNGAFITFSFIGTGCDIIQYNEVAGGSDTYTLQIDGGGAIAFPTAGVAATRVTKLVSGLPYGQHTIRINRVTATTWTLQIGAFIVYGPKKPTLPTGAVELADYNVMANYAIGGAGLLAVSTGVMRKSLLREIQFTGTWTDGGIDTTNYASGYDIDASATNSTAKYTFYGTGVELRLPFISTFVVNQTLSIDGSSNLSGFTTSLVSGTTGVTFTASTGVLSGTPAATSLGNVVSISGLTLGLHTITLTTNAATRQFIDSFDVITPIHAYVSKNTELQSTLLTGSCSLNDTRKTSALPKLTNRFRAVALGQFNTPTTTSTAYIQCPNMVVSVPSQGSWFRLGFTGNAQNNTTNGGVFFQFFVNGEPTGVVSREDVGVAGRDSNRSLQHLVYLSPGIHQVSVNWAVGSGTGGMTGSIYRSITVEEI